jgi:F0F1-type ATP synthase membrane subunit b/b'
MGIQITGNDIEIDGEKVARILDTRSTLNDKLEDYIAKADASEEIDEELSQVKDELKEVKNNLDDIQDQTNEAFSRGYAEGKNDANSN